MPIVPPELDDRRFEDLVREAKTLIPRYAPEWTDQNDSDPGITLIHLFAWMTEAMLYRVNQVPERHYLKFLQLLGIERRPAQPGRVELRFEPTDLTRPEVLVPRFTQVAVAGAGGDEPLVFETERSVAVLGATLDLVHTFDGRRHRVLGPDEFLPFGSRPEPGMALVFGLKSDAEFTSQVVEVHVFVAPSPDIVRACGASSRYPLPGRLEWERWDTPTGRWRSIELIDDETRALTRTGVVRFRGPGPAMQPGALPDVSDVRYWFRARLVAADYQRAPRLEEIAINTVPATQALTVYDEVLGRSDGSPDQVFQLAHVPVVAAQEPQRVAVHGGTVEVTNVQIDVLETVGSDVRVETWEDRRDFDESFRTSRHVVVDLATGRVEFGDGEHGDIPRLDAQIVARRYRYGGGLSGRVGPGSVTELLMPLTGISSVTNDRPSWGAQDEQSLDDAKREAPRLLKSRGRAVTAEDFEQIASATPFVPIARTLALPLAHPSFPGVVVPGSVTVVVVPRTDDPAPHPTEHTLRSVCAHLETRRLITTEVHVVGPTYRRLAICADVVVDARADLARAKHDAEARLTEFVHPLVGGREGAGWPFGQTLYFSDLYRLILDVPSVYRVEQGGLVLLLDGEDVGECQDVPIGRGELFELVDVQVRPLQEQERRR